MMRTSTHLINFVHPPFPPPIPPEPGNPFPPPEVFGRKSECVDGQAEEELPPVPPRYDFEEEACFPPPPVPVRDDISHQDLEHLFFDYDTTQDEPSTVELSRASPTPSSDMEEANSPSISFHEHLSSSLSLWHNLLEKVNELMGTAASIQMAKRCSLPPPMTWSDIRQQVIQIVSNFRNLVNYVKTPSFCETVLSLKGWVNSPGAESELHGSLQAVGFLLIPYVHKFETERASDTWALLSVDFKKQLFECSRVVCQHFWSLITHGLHLPNLQSPLSLKVIAKSTEIICRLGRIAHEVHQQGDSERALGRHFSKSSSALGVFLPTYLVFSLLPTAYPQDPKLASRFLMTNEAFALSQSWFRCLSRNPFPSEDQITSEVLECVKVAEKLEKNLSSPQEFSNEEDSSESNFVDAKSVLSNFPQELKNLRSQVTSFLFQLESKIWKGQMDGMNEEMSDELKSFLREVLLMISLLDYLSDGFEDEVCSRFANESLISKLMEKLQNISHRVKTTATCLFSDISHLQTFCAHPQDVLLRVVSSQHSLPVILLFSGILESYVVILWFQAATCFFQKQLLTPIVHLFCLRSICLILRGLIAEFSFVIEGVGDREHNEEVSPFRSLSES